MEKPMNTQRKISIALAIIIAVTSVLSLVTSFPKEPEAPSPPSGEVEALKDAIEKQETTLLLVSLLAEKKSESDKKLDKALELLGE